MEEFRVTESSNLECREDIHSKFKTTKPKEMTHTEHRPDKIAANVEQIEQRSLFVLYLRSDTATGKIDFTTDADMVGPAGLCKQSRTKPKGFTNAFVARKVVLRMAHRARMAAKKAAAKAAAAVAASGGSSSPPPQQLQR